MPDFPPVPPPDVRRLEPAERDSALAAVVAASSSPQGQGVGSAVVAPVLAAADRTGTAAWLETTSERNVRFYERLGFAVAREVDLPDGGPRCWLLHREPRRDGPAGG